MHTRGSPNQYPNCEYIGLIYLHIILNPNNGPRQTYMVPRASSKESLLTSASGKTYTLPANTSVILNICAIHFNASYWPDPSRFNPLRFVGQSVMDKDQIDASLWL